MAHPGREARVEGKGSSKGAQTPFSAHLGGSQDHFGPSRESRRLFLGPFREDQKPRSEDHFGPSRGIGFWFVWVGRT